MRSRLQSRMYVVCWIIETWSMCNTWNYIYYPVLYFYFYMLLDQHSVKNDIVDLQNLANHLDCLRVLLSHSLTISSQVTLLNFAIASEGLDQMLGLQL